MSWESIRFAHYSYLQRGKLTLQERTNTILEYSKHVYVIFLAYVTVEKGEEEGNYVWLMRLVDRMRMCIGPSFEVGVVFTVAINNLYHSFSDHFG